ncbi:MAG TPA: hypothetical protein DEB56_13615 [Thiobacillus sp.]|nr:hypothetical protein [Thiobacillus sp.]
MKISINSAVQSVKKMGRDAYAVIDNATGKVVAVTTGVMAAAGEALAVPPDFTALTSGIDLSTLEAAVLAALVALLGLYLIMGGGKTIIGFFKGGR